MNHENYLHVNKISGSGIPSIFLFTGEVQEGKTTFVSVLVQRLKKEGVKVAGFISPGEFSGNTRIAFSLEDLEHGERIPLARAREMKGWIRFRRYWFNPLALAAGEGIIGRAIEQRADLVIVDEVGPWELEGGGWAAMLDRLAAVRHVAQLWVVREGILNVVTRTWRVPPEQVFKIGEHDEEAVAARLSSAIHSISTTRE
jgi:nucleoside-triphosphatase THEP1